MIVAIEQALLLLLITVAWGRLVPARPIAAAPAPVPSAEQDEGTPASPATSRTWRHWLRAVCFGYTVSLIATLIAIFAVSEGKVYRQYHTLRFFVALAGLTLVLAAVGIAIAVVWQRLRGERTRPLPPLRPSTVAGRVALALVGVVTLGLAALLVFVPYWFHIYFGTISGDQFLFLVLGNQGGQSTEAVAQQMLNYMYVPVIGCAIAGAQLAVWWQGRWPRLAAVTVHVLLVALAVPVACHWVPLREALAQQTGESVLDENYVDPNLSVTFPEHKRNLIHIYMESVENSYYGQDHGGYGPDNLMPELMELNATYPHFSHRSDTFGGPHQTTGATHSIAAMVNMEAGVPLVTIAGKSDTTYSYPNFSTIGDLLAKQGYTNEIMLGADASWGGLDGYYWNHGDFLVFDHQHAIKAGLIPSDYQVWWGYEDDKLYDYAKDELTRLAGEGKPFYFILENADTHFPDGYVSPRMTDKPFDAQYANVIHYSQAEVARFIQWAQTQPWYENTTIVVTGDHRSMDKNFFATWPQSYERTIVNFYINSVAQPASQGVQFNRDFAPFDFFPTTLASIGATMEDERAGLGTNLFSGKPTLIEREGFDKVNNGLGIATDLYRTYTPPAQ